MVKLGAFSERDTGRSAGPSQHWRHAAFPSRGRPALPLAEEGASAGRARGLMAWEGPVVLCV